MQEKQKKISTKKIVIALLSFAMITGFVILFVAASNSKRGGVCNGLLISFDTKNMVAYTDTAWIRHIIVSKKELNPLKKPLTELDIPLTKQLVDKQDWVAASNIYVGNHDLLHIKITQKIPIARIFSRAGNSYYLDEDGDLLSAKGKFTIELPVFTGYPAGSPADSSLLQQISEMSHFIAQSSFWKAQLDQININANNEFEMIPRVGDALLLFGSGENIEEKFNKLMTFYKNGMNNIGWGYYDTIDLRFDGQIVASKKGTEDNPVVTNLITHNRTDN